MKPQRPRQTMRCNSGANPVLLLVFFLQSLFVIWTISNNHTESIGGTNEEEQEHYNNFPPPKEHGSKRKHNKEDDHHHTVQKQAPPESTNKCISGYPFVPCDATMRDMRYDYFDCGPREETMNRPLLNESERMLMRGLYHGIVGPSASTVGGFPSFGNGFNVPIVDIQHKSHGRSVWVEEDVKKGTLVWSSQGQTSCFAEGYLWRQFILSLPRYLVCDGMAFSYMAIKLVEHKEYAEDGSVTVTKKEKIMACTDTDEGAFMNSGDYKGSNANVGCPPGYSKKKCEYGLKMYALRDMKKGEEILCSYDDIWVPKGWESLGL